ncbi:MAG: hypothetical protein R3B95_07640 [Nitrospirales bacterium]|nr:hypothetical protein [Nitrospirales bacterium]
MAQSSGTTYNIALAYSRPLEVLEPSSVRAEFQRLALLDHGQPIEKGRATENVNARLQLKRGLSCPSEDTATWGCLMMASTYPMGIFNFFSAFIVSGGFRQIQLAIISTWGKFMTSAA